MELFKRGTYLIGGLYLCSLGVILSVLSSIGITPVNTISYALNVGFPSLTLGEWTMLQNYAFIFLQIIILRKEFKLSQLSQVIVVMLFGAFLDFNNLLVANIVLTSYISQFGVLLAGTALMALGISITCKANGPMNPAEALVKVLSDKTNIGFGNFKVLFDVAMVVITVIFSLLTIGEIVGIREGTVIMAIFTGLLVKVFNNLLNNKDSKKEETTDEMVN